jgi:hypothetical protein
VAQIRIAVPERTAGAKRAEKTAGMRTVGAKHAEPKRRWWWRGIVDGFRTLLTEPSIARRFTLQPLAP